ncbi:MAG TPA: TCR/Tet family MFS transporter [Candidatus Limnocylindria bacterium]|nr:TCR/Tet family MFS transporter [Candidatus Limnocylindria bacterium]
MNETLRAPTRAAFAFIFITVLLDMLAFGLVVPILPRLVVRFEGGNTADAAAILGLFGTVWAVMQLFFSPVLGALSDRFGRRPVVLLSNLGLGLDYVVMALAPNVGWLFVGRVISGITSSSFSTAGAYIADVTPPDRRAARFGMLGVAFGIGFIVGPAVGGLLGSIDLRAPFAVAAALSLANFAYGVFVLPESLPRERRAPFHPRAANPIGALAFLRARPGVVALAAAAFLAGLAHDVLPNLFVLYTDYRFGWDERTVGLALALVGLSSMVVQGLVVGRVVAALGERRALATGLVIGIAGLAIFGLAPTSALFALGIPVWAMFGLVMPSLQGLVTRRVSATEQGRLQGALGSIRAVASVTAPILFTQVFAASVGGSLAGAPFLLGAALLVGSLLLTSRDRGSTASVGATSGAVG